MSDRMTDIAPRIRVPEFQGVGFQRHGRRTRAEMLAAFRRHHERQIEIANYALSLTDAELIVETFTGTWARNNPKEVTE